MTVVAPTSAAQSAAVQSVAPQVVPAAPAQAQPVATGSQAPTSSADTHLHGVTIVDNEGALGQATPSIRSKPQEESLADAARRVKRSKPQ